MTDKTDFLRVAEQEVHRCKRLEPTTMLAWDGLPPEVRAALLPSVTFMGCNPAVKQADLNVSATDQEDRIGAARLMLLKLELDTSHPVWSSSVLERVVTAIMDLPGATVDDLLFATYGVLGDYRVRLSETVTHFLKDLVVICFTRYRRSYEALDWSALAHRVAADATDAQLFLVFYAVPPEYMSAELEQIVRTRLAASSLRDEVPSVLAG